jgi:hypothetical protein
MNLGTGDDHGKVFGNKNIVYLGEGNDELEVASRGRQKKCYIDRMHPKFHRFHRQ